MDLQFWMIDWTPAGYDWLLAICIVTALTSLPLALRLVPPNCVYGFRTRFTRSSREVWFDANAFMGRAMLGASLASALILSAYPQRGNDTLAPIAIVVVPMALATFAGFVYLRHLRETSQRR